ncbi:hypothetical protein ABK040_001381 [Willaertia magna]
MKTLLEHLFTEETLSEIIKYLSYVDYIHLAQINKYFYDLLLIKDNYLFNQFGDLLKYKLFDLKNVPDYLFKLKHLCLFEKANFHVLENFTNLKSLNSSHIPEQYLIRLTNLEKLYSMAGRYLTKHTLLNLKNLKSLTIGWNKQLNDDWVKDLTNLKKLCLFQCPNFKGESLLNLNNITKLILSNCDISGKYFVNLKQLKVLRLRDCNNLLDINFELFNLRKLYIQYCPNITLNLLQNLNHTYHTSVTNQILYNDVTTFITIFFVFIYYLTLIPMVNKPSIKIRLSLPYLAPLFVFIANILLIIPIINRCLMIMMVVQVILVALIVGIYGLTLFRVVYLRNIYKIIESFSGNQIKFIKILTSKGSGIVITILFSLLYALFWFTIAMIITFTLKYRNEGSTGINSLFTLCVLVNVVLGTVCMIIEIILNVKTIRKEGLRNFLIFDDPFYQRFDLITLVIIFGVTLPMPIIEVRNHYSIAILRTVAYISVLFLSGGTTLIFEYYNLMVNFYNDLFKRNDKGEDKKDKESQLSELEQKLENASFYKLLKKYAEKEFSLENILLYDQLMILKAKHKENSLIFKEELNDLSVNYIQSFSKYEVNFPSKIKLEFSNVISENRDVTFNQLYDILKTDLMLNIGDTCKRLEKTNEYRQLMDFLTLQKENYIV